MFYVDCVWVCKCADQVDECISVNNLIEGNKKIFYFSFFLSKISREHLIVDIIGNKELKATSPLHWTDKTWMLVKLF